MGDPAGNAEEAPMLPAESKFLERKGTGNIYHQKKSMRKQPFIFYKEFRQIKIIPREKCRKMPEKSRKESGLLPLHQISIAIYK